MKLKIFIALGCVLPLLAVAVFSHLDAAGTAFLMGCLAYVFWIAIAVGMVARLVGARRGRRVRDAFSPMAGAADAYQSLLLGQPTMALSVQEASHHDTTDRFTSGR
ncbi:hypothetical protein [Arthrobacter sp. 35W]|uniref:hypothetical protein n=1 Tax=Arthrobacter sp. 35W TaxID=1132441 RepID=UPI00040490ED|nr:hypothetical protein [Arthrobacter sp. 35W]